MKRMNNSLTVLTGALLFLLLTACQNPVMPDNTDSSAETTETSTEPEATVYTFEMDLGASFQTVYYSMSVGQEFEIYALDSSYMGTVDVISLDGYAYLLASGTFTSSSNHYQSLTLQSNEALDGESFYLFMIYMDGSGNPVNDIRYSSTQIALTNEGSASTVFY